MYASLQGEVEAEMTRLRLILKQTMDMYSLACKEAIAAQNKVKLTTTSLYETFIWALQSPLQSRIFTSEWFSIALQTLVKDNDHQ